jgi:hypothetical protein
VEDLCLSYAGLRERRPALALGQGWARRWTATWKFGSAVVCPIRDLASMPTAGCEPVSRFRSWRGRGSRTAGGRHGTDAYHAPVWQKLADRWHVDPNPPVGRLESAVQQTSAHGVSRRERLA